ncbi:HAD family hydrolase [Streptomyces sp. NPDC047706]|uniref:HAD family hydrolase n=1 Tax=Streptomyces sp. NPDC047706 TaxID=3365486 RepID=UPI0037121B36
MKGMVIVFDGDDTLWETESLYEDALTEAAEYVEDLGLEGATWIQAQREYDLRNVTTMGLSSKRFPASCVQAYRKVASNAGNSTSIMSEARIRKIAESVFTQPAKLMPGVVDAINRASRWAPLALLTAGDQTVQIRRIAHSGLATNFSCMRIVPRKTDAVFLEITEEFNATPAKSWSIGNSLPSDINPALRAGLSAVWVPADVWAYEHRETEVEKGRLLRASSISEAVDEIIAQSPAALLERQREPRPQSLE